MYKHCYKAQDFVDEWTTRLGLPTVFVKEYSKKKFTAGIIPTASTVLFNPKEINDRQIFVVSLLHELCHWWFYWNHTDESYADESKVIPMTVEWIKKYYPSYFQALLTRYARIIRRCEKYISEDLVMRKTEHYYGFIKVLVKYGVITNVKKVTQ